MAKSRNGISGTSAPPARELDGVFRGLANVIKAAANLVGQGENAIEVSRTGAIGDPNSVRGLYGFSVRVGPARRPNFAQPVGLRRRAVCPPNDHLSDFPADLFDEGDHYLVIVELPGTDRETLRWKISGGVLRIESAADDRHYCKEMPLPSPVNETHVTSGYKNGILELRLWKE